MDDIKKYKTPISYNDIENEDILLEQSQLNHYKDEIEHFKRTSELYISLFSNSKRQHLEEGKLDHIQLIAIRIFQDTRSSLILALRGLYPQSASLLRGVLESINLIYDFVINPTHEDLWFNAGKNKRKELFKASAVRKRVEESKRINLEPSKGLYNLLSDFSVHTNMESHLWYIETTDKVYYHWAGYRADKRSDALILSVLCSLAQGLFVLTYEDIYAHDRYWGDAFTEWKKNHLVYMKKFGKVFGDDDIEKLEVKEDKVIYVGDLK